MGGGYDRWSNLPNNTRGGGWQNKTWVLVVKSRSQVRQRGKVGLNKSLIYRHALPNSHPKFLFGPLQLSSQKIFLCRRNGGICPLDLPQISPMVKTGPDHVEWRFLSVPILNLGVLLPEHCHYMRKNVHSEEKLFTRICERRLGDYHKLWPTFLNRNLKHKETRRVPNWNP